MKNHKKQELMAKMQLFLLQYGNEEFTDAIAEVFYLAAHESENEDESNLYSLYAKYMTCLNDDMDELDEEPLVDQDH